MARPLTPLAGVLSSVGVGGVISPSVQPSYWQSHAVSPDRRTRGQCSFYISEWPPWEKTFTPCAYFRLGYFQAVAAKRPSISLADGPELR